MLYSKQLQRLMKPGTQRLTPSEQGGKVRVLFARLDPEDTISAQDDILTAFMHILPAGATVVQVEAAVNVADFVNNNLPTVVLYVNGVRVALNETSDNYLASLNTVPAAWPVNTAAEDVTVTFEGDDIGGIHLRPGDFCHINIYYVID